MMKTVCSQDWPFFFVFANMVIASMVVLYSRLTSLSTVFTFRMSKPPLCIPMSTSDPYHLTLMGNEYNSKMQDDQHRGRKDLSIYGLQLRPASYAIQKGSTPTGLGALYREESVRFYYLSTLYNDLSLQKSLYVSQATTDTIHVLLPLIQSQQEISEAATVASEGGFIVPNRVLAKGRDDLSLEPEMQITLNKKKGKGYQSKPDEDPRTLNFEWLERGIRSLLARSSRPGMHISSGISFDECLMTLKAATENKLNSGTPPLTLLYVCCTSFSWLILG